ncbi:hypothetical protein [Streptomyces sp. NPDC059452]|uniref:hypothetical protein n=1 Tax=Streptomyces sp. NPDC059452 TaxID=3346835 RepID=UPI0036A7E6EB
MLNYWIGNQWQRMKKAGLVEIPEGMVVHGFRHFFASNCLTHTIPITDVAEWIGNRATTCRRTGSTDMEPVLGGAVREGTEHGFDARWEWLRTGSPGDVRRPSGQAEGGAERTDRGVERLRYVRSGLDECLEQLSMGRLGKGRVLLDVEAHDGRRDESAGAARAYGHLTGTITPAG